MDDSNIIRGVLTAQMVSNTTIGVDPLLVLAPTIRPYNAPYGSGVLLNIVFGGAPFQTGAGSLNPGGFDLSGIRVYGDTLMSFSQALGGPLNSQYVQFQGIGCMFENGLTATFFGSGAQYLVKFRASTFGFSAPSTIGSGVHVVANNNGDLDLRGCNLANCDLAVSGNAGIDRDCLVTTDVTLGSTGSVGIFPPLPSYVTGFAAGNGYAVATAVDDELAGQIGIKGTSNYNHVDYTFTTLGTPVKGQFTITRQPNPSS